MGGLSPTHWVVVALVFLVLFGAKRLPDSARDLGRSMRILKAELRADDSATATASSPAGDASTSPAAVRPTYTAPAVAATSGDPTPQVAPSAEQQPITRA